LTTTDQRRAARRIDYIHLMMLRMPYKTARWFLHQELAEAEYAYFETGSQFELEVVKQLESIIQGAP
jgi:hypothetical protein